MIKKKEEKEASSERWLLTYSDLITLLMMFFIVMYASSTVDSKKYAEIAKSLNIAFGGSGKNIVGTDASIGINRTPSVENANIPSSGDSEAAEKAESEKFKEIKKQVDQYLNSNGLSSSASSSIQERGLVVSINDAMFFKSGSADISDATRSELVTIGRMLATINNYIVVEGNTDSDPISNSAIYKDNWDLASQRANNVMRLLIEDSGIQSTKISGRTNGEFRPIASNGSDAGKAKNRRVDIVIMSSKYNPTETNQKK